MRKLDSIAKSFKTDKSSEVHDYCRKYERWLNFERFEPINILEVGVYEGSSLLMWKEFYPHATIVGIDINPNCKKHEDTNKKIFVEIGSQTDSKFLTEVNNKFSGFNLIIDDGSHMQKHIIASFDILFPFLKSEGIYVVEDAVSAYWDEFGGGIKKKGTCIEFFKNLIEDVNFFGEFQQTFYLQHARREDFLIPDVQKKNPKIRTDIESINFLNSLIFITKKII